MEMIVGFIVNIAQLQIISPMIYNIVIFEKKIF